MANDKEKEVKGNHKGEIPNKVFCKTDPAFIAACDNAGVNPTSRQASKWRMGKGSAFKAKKG